MPARVGVDTGGTFTDFVRLDGGRLVVHKVRSTPDDPSLAIASGLSDLGAEYVGRAFRPGSIIHGSTVATNAVLERRGARVGLITTRGFEDVLRIGRQTRGELYNIFIPLPRPLVQPGVTVGVTERIGASGEVLEVLDSTTVTRAADLLAAARVDIVAICLLHAYANSTHEQQVAATLRGRGMIVCASHEVLPEYREFERFSTTVVSAYVTPLIDSYLGRLEVRLSSSTVPTAPTASTRLSIMQSNGGTISAASARAQAVRTILSGPAAGVVGARAVAKAAGFPRVISFDMGGTSTDVSLIDGAISTTTESVIGDFPIRLPVIDIETVGAGGGSIAAVDVGGALRVGPRSAGADPGPACYGRGEELTVTDANLLLGRLDPDFFFDGRMTLDVGRARRAAAALAKRLRLSVDELAEGVVRVANANMERAIRVVSLQRGHDPRQFALLAFGGAGGMHACEIAARLEMASVLVPRHAGVLSALGMLEADVAKDYSAPVLRPAAELDPRDLTRRFAPLAAQAERDLETEGFNPRNRRVVRALDVRYAGQSYELTVPFSSKFRQDFDRLHQRRYGYADPARPIEVVNVRIAATGITPKPKLPFRRPVRSARAVPAARRVGRFAGRRFNVASYRWSGLPPGAHAAGPALITSGEATVVIPPGFGFSIDGFGNVVARA
jgi:N-methylhydantoinase A/oxoprolinase/acetone carboxylase beta subunit